MEEMDKDTIAVHRLPQKTRHEASSQCYGMSSLPCPSSLQNLSPTGILYVYVYETHLFQLLFLKLKKNILVGRIKLD